jgi:hypothetical protein
MRPFWKLLALATCAVATPGCSDGRLPTVPVTGRVVFLDGSPVRTGTVELQSRTHPIQARGTIDPDGSFRLTTYDAGDGAVAGTHDCVVVQTVIAEKLPGFVGTLEGVVDPRFASYATSGLKAEIKPGQVNSLTLEVRGLVRPGGPKSTHQHAHDRGHEHKPDPR